MVDFRNREREAVFLVYRYPQFERCLDDLRKKCGTAAAAARKVDDFINNLMQKENNCCREKFRLTRNGEYRIKNCIKIDLVGGYRLVCIQKDCYLVLLYVGSHDECFRWIERNKGLTYEVEHATHVVKISRDSIQRDDSLPEGILEERRCVEEYEKRLMSKLDDNILLKIFPGWRKESQA